MTRLLCKTAILLVCVQMLPLWAASADLPDQAGALRVTIIEFPDLRDNKREGRRVPIKVHVPQQRGKWPVVIFSHGGGETGTPISPRRATWPVMVMQCFVSNMWRQYGADEARVRFMDNLKAP
jgi:acetyl esterase/lipase